MDKGIPVDHSGATEPEYSGGFNLSNMPDVLADIPDYQKQFYKLVSDILAAQNAALEADIWAAVQMGKGQDLVIVDYIMSGDKQVFLYDPATNKHTPMGPRRGRAKLSIV